MNLKLTISLRGPNTDLGRGPSEADIEASVEASLNEKRVSESH